MEITLQTKPLETLKEIERLREQKGKEKETIAVVENALKAGHDWIINLLWEEALTYQHLVMNEDAKPESERDLTSRKTALLSMEKVIKEASHYIKKFGIKKWYSRMHRFLGRLSDYKKEYRKAAVEYKKAIKYVRSDPDYTEKKIPRQLELEAFLAHSTLVGVDFQKGLDLSKKVYEKFNNTLEGRALREKDYSTWAIWKTGVPIRTIKALLLRKIKFNRKLMKEWLAEAEKDLSPKDRSIWTDFSYRKSEIKALKSELLGVKAR